MRPFLPSSLGVALIVALWSLGLGWGLAQASEATRPPEFTVASLDVVPERFQLGEQVYLRECSSCHIAPSPAVMPTQSWGRILVQEQHYGTQITPLRSPVLDLVWNYLQFSSRPLRANEEVPQRIDDSRFFRALHPDVDVPRASLASCVSCHPGATNYNYRELSPEWQSTP
ncbi:cytochrome C [Leptolyngbya sp. FACHB-16]|uniref:cytochrome C n=1 Tax=unclassified Leptolyngbya TaxID=2650499 RepID=UPI0016876CAC|nr:cytochrome C [Leptolyngbya sp. FACHB-16]MBD2155609.1 cytochrome C [Leptolyngbya sp. FACHB-16]